MNYRHHYHAGNFADVWKHALLLALVRGLQRKEKGFLYLETHAGRGVYDLLAAAQGDSLVRQPEWPDGIGRVEAAAPGDRPALANDYLAAVQAFAATPAAAGLARPYPGSPWLVQRHLRPQDRMVVCERHPEEHAWLARQFERVRRVRVEASDGYAAIAAHLPPLERRALVLIDPPYEAMDEFNQVIDAVAEALRRLPAATIAVWYPLTERARSDAFLADLVRRRIPPAWTAELTILGPENPAKLKGCGLLVVNPPWRMDTELAGGLPQLAALLRRSPAGEGALRWLVPE